METKNDPAKIREQMKELVDRLNEAAKAYYVDGREIMSNLEYDALYDELEALERETGIVLAKSPTVNVGYEVLTDLPKEAHQSRMLSLNKTKSTEELAAFVGAQPALLSWKLDGLTVVLTYRDGELFKAVTRGNGEIGEVITGNAKVFDNVPLRIPYTGELVVRGEAIITYSEFEKINETIPEEGAKYKNPRNLCSGSVRQLDNRVTAERHVRFVAFSMVDAADLDFTFRHEQYAFLKEQGFEVVEYKEVTGETVPETVAWFASMIEDNDYPSDGLVVVLDDVAYGRSLGTTAKYPRDSIAFKWQDEQAETTLLDVEWSPSRTGLINPVAIFEPVDLEGTQVSRASVHNVSIARELKLGIGDRIKVYKANMIIPQIAENLTKSGTLVIPDTCPVCGGRAEIHREGDVETLYCVNEDCPAKKINAFALFVSRNALNIDGMSSATIEKLIDIGAIKTFGDFFRLEEHRDAIVAMEGFGEKSYENMLKAAEVSRDTTCARLLTGLGIPGIGGAVAGLIAEAGDEDMEKIRHMTKEELLSIDGIGDVLADAFCGWFADEKNGQVTDDLLSILRMAAPEDKGEQDLAGLTFVVTGSLETYPNRDALKEEIKSRGGKVAGSVSGNTDYLINNDINSTSGKNKKAKELGIPIISEQDYLDRFPR